MGLHSTMMWFFIDRDTPHPQKIHIKISHHVQLSANLYNPAVVRMPGSDNGKSNLLDGCNNYVSVLHTFAVALLSIVSCGDSSKNNLVWR